MEFQQVKAYHFAVGAWSAVGRECDGVRSVALVSAEDGACCSVPRITVAVAVCHKLCHVAVSAVLRHVVDGKGLVVAGAEHAELHALVCEGEDAEVYVLCFLDAVLNGVGCGDERFDGEAHGLVLLVDGEGAVVLCSGVGAGLVAVHFGLDIGVLRHLDVVLTVFALVELHGALTVHRAVVLFRLLAVSAANSPLVALIVGSPSPGVARDGLVVGDGLPGVVAAVEVNGAFELVV